MLIILLLHFFYNCLIFIILHHTETAGALGVYNEIPISFLDV